MSEYMNNSSAISIKPRIDILKKVSFSSFFINWYSQLKAFNILQITKSKIW